MTIFIKGNILKKKLNGNPENKKKLNEFIFVEQAQNLVPWEHVQKMKTEFVFVILGTDNKLFPRE